MGMVLELPVVNDGEEELPETDHKGNPLRPKRVYEPDPPPTDPLEATICETRSRVLVHLSAIAPGNASADDVVSKEWLLFAIEGMRERPLAGSLTADPLGEAQVDDALRKLGLLTELNKILGERKRARATEIKARQREREKSWSKALNGPAIEYTKTDETAAEWAKSTDLSEPEAQLEMRARLNDEYMFGRYGGKVRIAHITKFGVDFLTVDDLRHTLAPFVYPRQGKSISAANDWIAWAHRTEYVGVGFYPGSDLPGWEPKVPTGHINLWRGLAIGPKPGDWSKLKSHILHAICQGNQKHFDWLMDWLAHMLQRPQEKPGTCVALKGLEGAGKTILLHVMRRILGPYAHSVSQSKHIIGNFNSHLEHCILLGCEEALWAGDKAGEGVLKDLGTATQITIERKGVDAVSVANYTRLMLITNNDWCVPAGPNSRRYFVLEVKNDHAAKRGYFDPIYDEIENGGDRAMLDELLKRKIRRNLRFAPITKGLLSQREQSLTNLERWLLEVARTGTVIERDGTYHSVAATKSGAVPANALWDAAKHKCGNDHGFYRTLGPLLSSVGVTKSRPRVAGKQVPCYMFPEIDDLRANVSKHLGIPVSEDAGDDIMTFSADDIDQADSAIPSRPAQTTGATERRMLH